MVGTFTFLYGIYTSLGSVVSFLTEDYYPDPAYNSLFGAVFILSGVVGSFICGIILDKTSKYKLMLFLVSLISMISVFCCLFTLKSGSVPLFSINLMFVGASVISIIPVSYSFAVELTYPISEAMSNGMMIMVSQIFGALIVNI